MHDYTRPCACRTHLNISDRGELVFHSSLSDVEHEQVQHTDRRLIHLEKLASFEYP